MASIFSFERLLKLYFARRGGQIRFYPFGLLGRGYIVEEWQVPNLERCVAVFTYGAIALLVPFVMLLQRGQHIAHFFWVVLPTIYALYWIPVRLLVRGKDGRVRRVAEQVQWRDMALNQTAERLQLRIGAGTFMTAICVFAFATMLLRGAPLSDMAMQIAGVLLFGIITLRCSRVRRVQKQLGPHADTTAAFD